MYNKKTVSNLILSLSLGELRHFSFPNKYETYLRVRLRLIKYIVTTNYKRKTLDILWEFAETFSCVALRISS